MKIDRRFFDTNVLLYLLSEDNRKADRAEAIIAMGGVISVQVLNEFASVASRKMGIGYCGAIRFFFIRQHDRQCCAAIGLYYFVFGRYAARPKNRCSIGDYKSFSGLSRCASKQQRFKKKSSLKHEEHEEFHWVIRVSALTFG